MSEYSKENLDYLRDNTRINIIEWFIIDKKREKIFQAYEDIRRSEHADIVTDYTSANEYEFNVRYQLWQRKLFRAWKKYGDGLDLEEFCNKTLSDNIKDSKEKKLVKEL